MAVIPTLDDMAATVADLERRLQAMESSAQLGNSSIRGGSLYILDDNVPPRVIVALGKVDQPGTSTLFNGAIIGNPASGIPMLWMNDGAGQLLPYAPWDAWHVTGASVAITDNVLQTRWSVLVEIATCQALKVSVNVAASVGTTGEIRIRHEGTGITTNLKVIGDGVNVIFDCYWLHPMVLMSGPARFHIDARRTSGAGTVTLFHPAPLTFGSFMVQATSGGWT